MIDAGQRIVLSNPAAELMFGHAAAAMLGVPFDMLLPAAARGAHAEHMRRFASSGVTQRRMGGLHRCLDLGPAHV